VTAEKALLRHAESKGLLPVAGGIVTHARPEDFAAQDVALCAESLCTVEEVIGRKPLRDPSQPPADERPLRSLNSERYLRTPSEALDVYRDRPEWLENTFRVAELCDDDVTPGRTRLPNVFGNAPSVLREATMTGANQTRASNPTNRTAKTRTHRRRGFSRRGAGTGEPPARRTSGSRASGVFGKPRRPASPAFDAGRGCGSSRIRYDRRIPGSLCDTVSFVREARGPGAV
jgi:hypothetical protein